MASIPKILRRRKLQMLGVMLANDFTITEHVQQLTTKSAQTLYALRVLKVHGSNNMLHCRKFIGRSSLADCSTQQVDGTDSPKHQSVNELTYCLIMRNVVVTVFQTYRHLKSYVKLQMTNSLIKLFPIPAIFCTPCCHHHPQHHNITIWGVVHTPILFPKMTLICVIVTF